MRRGGRFRSAVELCLARFRAQQRVEARAAEERHRAEVDAERLGLPAQMGSECGFEVRGGGQAELPADEQDHAAGVYGVVA